MVSDAERRGFINLVFQLHFRTLCSGVPGISGYNGSEKPH
jgi:hypothetical protein